MGDKYLSEVIDYERDMKSYHFMAIYSGVGSGKNRFIDSFYKEDEEIPNPQMTVLVITSRRAKADEILEENVSAEYKKALKDIGIYIKDQSVDDVAFERLSNYVHNRKRKVKIMYLIVSTFCNLNCKYCFID